MTAKRLRYAAAVVIVCLAVVAVGTLGVAGAKPTGKVKFDTKNSGPNAIEGVVKHKQKKGRKKVKVILKGPPPFDPAARDHNKLVKIGTDRTDKRGNFCFSAPKGGFFNAGIYEAKAKKKGFRYRKASATF